MRLVQVFTAFMLVPMLGVASSQPVRALTLNDQRLAADTGRSFSFDPIRDLHDSSGADFAPRFSTTAETEPNNSPASATDLPLPGNYGRGRGWISPALDLDYWAIAVPAGARVWAYVDTGGNQKPGANSRDSLLTLYARDGTTLVERDDDEALGNGCDATTESPHASIIAGHRLANAGTYYLKVEAYQNTTGVIKPYKLYVVLTQGDGADEGEPNDDYTTAPLISSPASPIGVRQGTVRAGRVSDEDWFSVVATAGKTLFVAVDRDPEKDGVGTDVSIDLYENDPTSVAGLKLLYRDFPPIPGTDPPGTGYCYTLPADDTYYIAVLPMGSIGTGSYRLMVAQK